MTCEMRGLTLTQPYASLVAAGAKQIETRSWATAYRGLVAIHAAQGLGPVGGESGLSKIVREPQFRAVLRGAGYNSLALLSPGQSLPRGQIVAVAELAGVWEACGAGYIRDPDRRVTERVSAQERLFGDYRPGRYCWLLANIRQLPQPVPCRGAQGLWRVPDEVRERIVAQL